MCVLFEKVFELNGFMILDLDCVELYSCFLCVLKMVCWVIDWFLDWFVIVFGGLIFGGGLIGNYMSYVVVCMVNKLC